MRKTLASLAFAASAMFTSCTAKLLENSEMIYGSNLNSVDNTDGKYNLPIVTIAGRDLNPQRSPRRQGQELDFLGKPYGIQGSLLVKDRANGLFDLETPTVFVAPPYLIPELGVVGRLVPAKEFVFNTTGPYALKARVKNPKAKSGERVGVKSLTHRNLEYEIETIEIDTDKEREGLEEFYVGVTRDSSGNIDKTIIFEVPTTKEVIDTKTGEIILRNPNMHFLKEIPATEYNSRPLTAPESRPTAVEPDPNKAPTGIPRAGK